MKYSIFFEEYIYTNDNEERRFNGVLLKIQDDEYEDLWDVYEDFCYLQDENGIPIKGLKDWNEINNEWENEGYEQFKTDESDIEFFETKDEVYKRFFELQKKHQ